MQSLLRGRFLRQKMLVADLCRSVSCTDLCRPVSGNEYESAINKHESAIAEMRAAGAIIVEGPFSQTE